MTDIDEELRGVMAAYGKTLKKVASALSDSFGTGAPWGIAGFQEAALVFLFAETLRSNGWNGVRYEPYYGAQSRLRGDVGATKGGLAIVVEGKWWWHAHRIDTPLDQTLNKLSQLAPSNPTERLALVWSAWDDTTDDPCRAFKDELDRSSFKGSTEVVAHAQAQSAFVEATEKKGWLLATLLRHAA